MNKQHAIDFAKWTAERLWSYSSRTDMWYQYNNEDNPVTPDELYKMWKKGSEVAEKHEVSDALIAELEK